MVLPEPQVLQPGDDPLASIRDEIGTGPDAQGFAGPKAPVGPPTPPGPVAEGAIQVTGYLLGWASALIALPYGLLRALWLWAAGRDLRTIGAED